jgi:hypothetical protein
VFTLAAPIQSSSITYICINISYTPLKQRSKIAIHLSPEQSKYYVYLLAPLVMRTALKYSIRI